MLVLSFQQDTRQGFTLCYMAADSVCQRQRRKGQDNEPYVTPRLGCLARPAHRAGVPLAAMGASPLTAAHAADTGPTCAVQRRIRPAGHPAQRRTGVHPHPLAIAGTDAADLRRLEQGDGATGSARADCPAMPQRRPPHQAGAADHRRPGADRTSHGRRRGQGRRLAAHGAEWGRTDPTDGFVAAGGGGRRAGRECADSVLRRSVISLPWRSPSPHHPRHRAQPDQPHRVDAPVQRGGHRHGA